MIFKEGEIVNKVLISSLKVAQKPLKSSSKAKKKNRIIQACIPDEPELNSPARKAEPSRANVPGNLREREIPHAWSPRALCPVGTWEPLRRRENGD